MPDSTDQPTEEAELSAPEGTEESDAEDDASKIDVDDANSVDDAERMARDTDEMGPDERPGPEDTLADLEEGNANGGGEETPEDVSSDDGEDGDVSEEAESAESGDAEEDGGETPSDDSGGEGDQREGGAESEDGDVEEAVAETDDEGGESPNETESSDEPTDGEEGGTPDEADEGEEPSEEEALERGEDEGGEVYETVQMAAIDRRAIEREGQVRQLEQTLPLLSSRFAPEIVVSPPRVLVQEWHDGLPEETSESEEAGEIPPEAAETQPSTPPTPGPEAGAPDDGGEAGEEAAAQEPSAAGAPGDDAEDQGAGPEGPPPTESVPTEDEEEGSRENRATPPARPRPNPSAEPPDEVGDGGEEPPKQGVRGPRKTPAMPSDVVDEVEEGQRGRRDTVPVEEGQEPTPSPASQEGIEEIGRGGTAESQPAGPQPIDVVDEDSERTDGSWVRQVFGELYLATVTGDIDDLTERETDFIEESLELDESGRVLDLACGWGRHTMELTDRGYDSLGFDLSKPLLERGLKEAKRRSLDVNYYHGDMRALEFEQEFDACFCWQTSFGYFDDRTNFDILNRVHRALEPGGTFLLDVMNRDFVIEDMPHRIWWEGRECLFLEEGDFDFATSTMHINRSFIYEDGRPPIEQDWYIRLYSPHELKALLRRAGFRVEEFTGDLHYRGYFIGEDSPRLIVKAKKGAAG